MSSGLKRMIFNTRERLVSTDINRAQALVGADLSRLFQSRYGNRAVGFHASPGSTQTPEAGTSFDILDGFELNLNAGVDLQVDSGFALIRDSSLAGSDDNAYVFVNDPGVVAQGVLTFTANASGSVRIDIVEFSIADVLLESSSRDQYNNTTGLFSAALVDKVRAARATWRIRTGTPGAGLPSTVVGWYPVAVLVVQNGATGFAQVDAYDVRPLVGERHEAATDGSTIDATLYDAPSVNGVVERDMRGAATYLFHAPATGQNAFYFVEGWARARYRDYWAGGDLHRNAPSSLANFGTFDGPNASTGLQLRFGSESVGVVPSAAGKWQYLYACFPGNLPRWVRYTQTAFGPKARRVPSGPRGLLVFSEEQPNRLGYRASVTLPATSGMTSAPGVRLLAFLSETERGASASEDPVIGVNGFGLVPCVFSKGTQRIQQIDAVAVTEGTPPNGNTGPTLTEGTHFPVGVDRVRYGIEAGTTGGPVSSPVLLEFEPDGYYPTKNICSVTNGSGAATFRTWADAWLDAPSRTKTDGFGRAIGQMAHDGIAGTAVPTLQDLGGFINIGAGAPGTLDYVTYRVVAWSW